MDAATFIANFRLEVNDTEEPHLWPTKLVLHYLDEAQQQFCDKTVGIADSLSPLCTVSASTELVVLSPLIKTIRRATLRQLQRELQLVSVEDARDDGMRLNGPTGVPQYLITGVGRNRAQLWPVPSLSYTLHLDVYRRPLSHIEDVGDELEVDDTFVPTLMHYVLYRAYQRPDVDTVDLRRSGEALALFNAGCKEAQALQSRARTKAGVTQFSW